MISSLIQALFKIKIRLNISEQEKKWQSDLLHAETKPKFLYLLYTIQRKNFFTEKELFKEKEEWRIEQKEGFLTALAMAIKKDPTSIRKYTNELKVHEKTVRTAIKQDLSPYLNPLDYAIWGVWENKTCNFPFKYWFT